MKLSKYWIMPIDNIEYKSAVVVEASPPSQEHALFFNKSKPEKSTA